MTTIRQLERYALMAVMLLALLSIVGFVALLSHGPSASSISLVSAEGNLVGEGLSRGLCGNPGYSGSHGRAGNPGLGSTHADPSC